MPEYECPECENVFDPEDECGDPDEIICPECGYILDDEDLITGDGKCDCGKMCGECDK